MGFTSFLVDVLPVKLMKNPLKEIEELLFSVTCCDKERLFTALVFSDSFWGAVKDVLLFREYEKLSSFEISNMEGKVIIDVGANVGLYSLIASVTAERVYSIEPSPQNFALLRKNIIGNSITNVKPIQKALWTKTGKAPLKIRELPGSHVINFGGYCEGVTEVDTLSFHDLLRITGPVNLAKIDIEGAEFPLIKQVLLQGYPLKKFINSIVMEVHFCSELGNTMAYMLRKLGYRVTRYLTPLISNPPRSRICLLNCRIREAMIRQGIAPLLKAVKYRNKDLCIFYAF